MKKCSIVFIPKFDLSFDEKYKFEGIAIRGSSTIEHVETFHNVIVLSEEELEQQKKEEILAYERWKTKQICIRIGIQNGHFFYEMRVRYTDGSPMVKYHPTDHYTEEQLYDFYTKSGKLITG